MRFITYTMSSNAIVLVDDTFGYLTARFADGITVYIRSPYEGVCSYAPKLSESEVIYAQLSALTVDAIIQALYHITGRIFYCVIDEDFEPVFCEGFKSRITPIDIRSKAVEKILNKPL